MQFLLTSDKSQEREVVLCWNVFYEAIEGWNLFFYDVLHRFTFNVVICVSLELNVQLYQFCDGIGCTLSEQLAHSTVDHHLKEISEFLHGSVMNKKFTFPCGTKVTPESAAQHTCIKFSRYIYSPLSHLLLRVYYHHCYTHYFDKFSPSVIQF